MISIKMATPESCTNKNTNKEDGIRYSTLAREGITLLLNNKQKEAELLFKTYPESIQMDAGFAFAVFMDALMTFEDDKLHLALQTLKDLEKKCSSNTGWMRTVRTKVFGSDANYSYADQLESQIILADSHVFVATLTFLQQDISGYFKGGWILRKSYKHYQNAYNEILNLYNDIVGQNKILINLNEEKLPTSEVASDPKECVALANQDQLTPVEMTEPNPTQPELSCNGEENVDPENTPTALPIDAVVPVPVTSPILEGPKDTSQNDTNAKPASSVQYKNGKDMDKETVSRLLCAVSFGYGLLQLGISLLPPSMLKLTNFLGFGGNRKSGLENLMFARLGSDMRAPFATLALLWYHTIVRPFFALDGNNVEAGVEAAARLIEETKEEYGQSALFLFFKGRVERLSSDIPRAIVAFQAAIENAAQKEIKMMSLHEVGWCYFIQLDFSKSETTFCYLKQSSRWSGPFYSYLCIICAGSNHKFQEVENVKDIRNIFQPVPKGTQLDEFLNRRYKICPMDETELKNTSCLFWKLFAYELLYLWNTLPSCTNENLHSIINDCQLAVKTNCEPLVGLAKLVEGSCCCILRRFNEGIDNFRICLENRKNLPYNCDTAHVSAFAQYELGLLLLRNEQTHAEGKKLLQLVAYNFKDYDFEQRLSVRVHAILKSI